jgi:hypothetical protein
MDYKKWLGPMLGVLLLTGIGAGIWHSFSDKSAEKQATAKAASQITVRVVSGSEKIPLLKDERLLQVLGKYNIALDVHKAGSREIAGLPDLKTYDVAFPAGQPAAEKIRLTTGAKKSTTAFATPMVVASWKPIAETLVSNGIVKQEAGAYWILDMAKLLELMAAGKRWRDLPNNTAFAVGKSVLVSTTNISTSNSAAQFLALSSYLFNGAEVVATPEQADAAARKIAPLFARQGFQESSSSGPFEDYLAIGMGKTPLVWIYEAQFLEYALRQGSKPEMVLLYPRPTIFTKHVMVALSDKGVRFVEAMADPSILAIAAEYGYRSESSGSLEAIRAAAKAKGLAVPDLVDLVDAPAYDMLERMIVAIESSRDNTGQNQPSSALSLPSPDKSKLLAPVPGRQVNPVPASSKEISK